ncbi:DUF1837 domain-containing protein [Acinetobacter pittii]|uniref:hypothetical protein n=1 Tax=Acinetobacter pittii TaxID=48296 RepID=UPI00355C6985
MNTKVADELTVRVKLGNKSSSGFIYPNTNHTYIFTAKHAVCTSDAQECLITKKLKCEKCTKAKTTKTKIIIDRPDVEDHEIIKIKDVVLCEDKDVAILVVKDEFHRKLTNLTKIKIVDATDIQNDDNFISCGYPQIADYEETQPISYTNYMPFRKRFSLRILNESIGNLESSKENLYGNSGAGILQIKNNQVSLFGIYTDTTGMGTGIGEYLDEKISNLLISKGYPKLELKNKGDGFEALIKSKFMECFSKIEHDIKLENDRELNLYRLVISGKDYNYNFINKRITNCIPFFSLSRKQINQSIKNDEFNATAFESVKKFLKLQSKDKIPEILLQGFLEAYCNAPRLYSSHHNKNSVFQGAHIKFSDDVKRKIEIIHCIALFSKKLNDSFVIAVKNIIDKYPNIKSFGGLIDSGFLDETYSEEESEILAKFLIPNSADTHGGYLDRLAIFIGYDRIIEKDLRYLQQSEFESKLEEIIINDFKLSLDDLKIELAKIEKLKAPIDCFLVPFEDTEKFNQDFFESLK